MVTEVYEAKFESHKHFRKRRGTDKRSILEIQEYFNANPADINDRFFF